LSLLLSLLVIWQGASTYFQNPRLTESSGIAVSRAYPGVLWTHNDSGDQPYLYATDLSGRDRGHLRVSGAHAVDWEDIALGPCPARTTPGVSGTCLYIADTGDKRETRSTVTIYAVPEPRPPQHAGDTLRATAPAAVLRLHYPDGPHDVEALYVLPRDTTVFLITKGRSGRSIHAYRIDHPQWAKRSGRARDVQKLDLRPDAKTGRLVTSASIRPDALVVAIRTYAEIYLYAADSMGRLTRTPAPPCAISALGPGGEAIDFVSDSTVVLTSEASRRHPGTISLVRLTANGGCAVSATGR
jgi:hypothetical protein